MIFTPEIQTKIAEWRSKARNGTLTKEEAAEAIALMRQARGAAPQATAGTKARKTAAKPNSDDLLSELEGL